MRNLLNIWSDLARAHGMKAIEDYLKEKQLL
jgi:hypothetical protein